MDMKNSLGSYYHMFDLKVVNDCDENHDFTVTALTIPMTYP